MAETIYTIKPSTLEAIGDAIREKTGTTDKITPENMATAVSEIQSGGSDTRFKEFIEGTLTEMHDDTIVSTRDYAFYNTSCTMYDLPNLETAGKYAFANTKVSMEKYVLPKLKTIGDYAFYGTNITNVDFLPSLETVGAYAFSNCTALENITITGNPKFIGYTFHNSKNIKSVVAENLTALTQYMFRSCTNLVHVTFPKVTSANSYSLSDTSIETIDLPALAFAGHYALSSSKKLRSLKLPSVTGEIYDGFISSCYLLDNVDFGAGSIYMGDYVMNNDYSLKTVIIRRTDRICTIESTKVFNNCYHFHGTVNATYNPDGLRDGHVYVPRALIEDYKVATNWVTFADQFRALEDYTVDGTTTGEMDWDKINGTTNE